MMSYYGGRGPMTNAVLWVEAVIFAVFVAMRLYTRICILNSVGFDDYLVCVALVLQIIYTIFVTVSSGYGLGRLFEQVGNPAIYFQAVKWEVFSQVAGILVIGVGKCAVGIFLLRIVRNKIQIGVIWSFIVATTVITLFASIGVVVHCIPVQKTWNPALPGKCWLDFPKLGLTIGSLFVVDDFAFAILPWFFIWDLNMKRKEKLTIAFGLSLGVFAGICGIVRTVALGGLDASEYIYDTVPMLIWSATESLMTIMCSSIPVLRPLYVKIKYGSKGDSNGNGASYNLSKFGDRQRYAPGSVADVEQKGVSHHAVITYNPNSTNGNDSDENILLAQGTHNMNHSPGTIKRTDEVTVNFETL